MTQTVFKRIFDVLLSFFLLIVTSPLIIVAFVIASFETRSSGLFVQNRIGKNCKGIKVLKIKTMYDNKSGKRDSITANVKSEISTSGHYLRKYKIDELPQLINVFLGSMSFVGPRPDVSGYADMLKGEDKIILSIKPGITGPASIKYKHEEDILAAESDPKYYNDNIIWPDKVKINKHYVMNYSFYNDLKYILKTVVER